MARLSLDNGPQSPEEVWSTVVEIRRPRAESGGYRLASGEAFGPAEPH